jgi:hypothetical protein
MPMSGLMSGLNRHPGTTVRRKTLGALILTTVVLIAVLGTISRTFLWMVIS